MSKPKICITTPEYPPEVGGVGESVNRISTMLINSGYEVHIAVFRPKQRLFSEGSRRRASCKTELQDGVYVHRIKSGVRDNSRELNEFLASLNHEMISPDLEQILNGFHSRFVPYLCNAEFYNDVYFQLKLLHQTHKFDLFHAFFMKTTGYVTTLLAKENDIPVINSVRGADLHKQLFNPENHGQTVWTLENSDWTTFVSRDLQKRAHILAPSIKSKSSAFLNSIVPIEFDELPTPPLVKELPGIVIGTTGRFRDKKGIEYLLDACTKLSHQIDITLLLVGDFIDKEKTYWEQELQECTLGNKLRITGIVSRQETLAYLPHLDIFAIPSLTDGCPNALLEAMLAGCAIVGSNVDAIGEVIEDGVDGLLVNPGNTNELAAALHHLAANPELRQKFGVAAKKKVREQLAPSVELGNWLKVYQQVLMGVKNGYKPVLSVI